MPWEEGEDSAQLSHNTLTVRRGGCRRSGLSGRQWLLRALTRVLQCRGWLCDRWTFLGFPSELLSPGCTQYSREQRECHPALAPQRPTATLPSVTGGNRALGRPESRRGAASSAGRRGKRSPRSPGPPPPGPCGRPRPSARGGAAAPARGAAESAGPAARGDAALQLGTHGDRHHPPEAARRRRPLPAEGARGSAGGRRGGPAGGVAGRSGGSTSPLVELPAERLSLFNPPSPLFLIFGAFG